MWGNRGLRGQMRREGLRGKENLKRDFSEEKVWEKRDLKGQT